MNRMSIQRTIVIIAVTLLIFGCATGASFEQMIYQGESKSYPDDLKDGIQIVSTQGGQETGAFDGAQISNDAFKSTIEESLRREGLYSESGDYGLDVYLLSVQQPFAGLSMTVTTTARYVMSESTGENSATVFDETLVTPYTASFGSSLFGPKRMRLATEGAARENIEALLDKLAATDVRIRLSEHDAAHTIGSLARENRPHGSNPTADLLQATTAEAR